MSERELARGVRSVVVPLADWLAEVCASAEAGYDFFDWLSAVDHTGARGDGTDAEPDPGSEVEPGMQLVLHLIASGERDRIPAPLPRLLLKTTVPVGGCAPSLTSIFAGAAWHERETHEMFGVEFADFEDGTGQGLRPLLLPEGFEGTPLAKSFVLAARASKPWPGAKEPGESDSDVAPGAKAAPADAEPSTVGQESVGVTTPVRRPRKRRRMLPPGVPDPTWGPRKP